MWPLRSRQQEGAVPQASFAAPEILAVVASPRDQAAVAEYASSNGWSCTLVTEFDEALSFSVKRTPAVVLLDRDLIRSDWRPAVRGFAQKCPAPCVILLSPVIDEYLFDEIVKQGGFDMVAKPIQPDELRRIGGLAVTYWKSRLSGNLNG